MISFPQTPSRRLRLISTAIAPLPTAAANPVLRWLSSRLWRRDGGGGGGSSSGGGGGDRNDVDEQQHGCRLRPVAVAEHVTHPQQGVDTGHVHPSICRATGGTLIIVYAANENDSRGKDVLMCTRSANHGASWDTPTPIDCTRFENRPPGAIADSDTHECYPGTLTALPAGRVLCTWDYTYEQYPQQGRPLLYTLSEDQVRTMGRPLVFEAVPQAAAFCTSTPLCCA
jgi:hypothetical protein